MGLYPPASPANLRPARGGGNTEKGLRTTPGMNPPRSKTVDVHHKNCP